MRLNLEISNTQMNSFKALQQRTGASSMKDLINHALSMLEWAVEETAKGNEIAAVNEEQSAYRVLVTPCYSTSPGTNEKKLLRLYERQGPGQGRAAGALEA